MAPRFAVRSVAIIGAGSSGLTAARYIQAQGVYDRIVVYEQRSQVGGIWNHSYRPTDQEHIPQESPYLRPDAPLQPREGKAEAPEFPTATYDDLYVNIPHPLMGFTDLSIQEVHEANHPGQPLPIFPHRQTIAEYLISYSQEVRHLIRFNTKVHDVRLFKRPRPNGQVDDFVDSWEIHSANTVDGSGSVEKFDAVLVAQGHYDITFVPHIANIEAFQEAHPGVLTHSKRYRNPDKFRGKKVIVVGNQASGLDIAAQIHSVVEGPMYLSVHTPTISEGLKRLTGAEEVPEIQEFLVEERGVRLADGRLIRDVDIVLFCTGYLFSLPFLQREKPTGENPLGDLLSNGRRIHRLYDDMFHIDHPTLAFLCLPMKVVPYPLAQAQAALVARVWNNTLELPSTEEMNEWEKEAEMVRGPTFHVWPQGDDGIYINALYQRITEGSESVASRAGKEPPRWNNYLVWMRRVALAGKVKFEEGGHKATTLAELGYIYDEDEEKKKNEEAKQAEVVEKINAQFTGVTGYIHPRMAKIETTPFVSVYSGA
ncbi:monooxygenase [Sporothrix eucalyptigena]|uniref:Monooxygenase n=1 Tax=Sporothrix eucalyptigena TaxID=1812306 RepID=A0ABP0D4R0_9PEZI